MNHTYILSQIIIIWLIGYIVYRKLYKRDNRVPIDDPGFIWLLVLLIYGTLPSVSWLFQQGVYSPLNGRLFSLQPSSEVIIDLLNIVMAYLLGFSITYLFLYKKVYFPQYYTINKIGQPFVVAAIVIIAVSFFSNFFLIEIFDFPKNTSRMEAYQFVGQLPLGLSQLLKLIDLLNFFSMLVIIIAIFQRWPKNRWLIWFYIIFLLLSLRSGGRSEAAVGLLTVVICWHTMVRPIPAPKLFISGIIGLICFLLIGMLRQLGAEGIIFSGIGEFDSLWANAVELYMDKNEKKIHMPFTTRFNDFWAPIPSQLLWFEKKSPSIWFLENFHPEFKSRGGGYAFGAIAEAVYGYGIYEGLIRGSIIGIICIKFMKWFRKGGSWWMFPMQLYLTIWIYQSVRDTTFRFIVDISQNVLPAIIVLLVLRSLLTIKESNNKSNLRFNT